jgi:hypothetical protein
VNVRLDSGRTVEQRMAALVEEQRKIDSVNRIPGVIERFNEIDGPPARFRTAAGIGYLVDYDCGDCGSYELFVGRPPQLASIRYGGDDTQPQGGRYLCEMKVVARTFNWPRLK